MSLQAQVSIASDSDDAYVLNQGSATYPPSGTASFYDADTILYVKRTREADTTYGIILSLLKFNTGSVLPDDASPVGGYLEIEKWYHVNTNNRDLVADYYPWVGNSSDYTATAANNAISGTPISGLSNGVIQIPLTGFSGISTTGFTYLRLHLSGAVPTGDNQMAFGAREHATFAAPKMSVDYIMRTRVAPDAITNQTGWDVPIVLTDVQVDPDV